MARAFIGNYKGPKGDKGDAGTQGKQGDIGATGQRGSRWSEGTAITGTSTTAIVFSGTGITDALANDMYMNTSTGNVYRCTTGGATDTAKWVFVGNIKGLKGDKGNKGDKGEKGDKGDKGETGATGASGTADTTFTEASKLTKLTSGESFKTMLGKIAKAVSTVFNKLDKSSVVNNNTTTEAGFAPDARQANPNIEGTMAANILQLNNDFSTSNDVDFYEENIIYGSHFEPINDADRIRCIKYKNGMRVITGAVRCVSEINDSDYMVFTLPEGFERNPQHGRHGKQAWVSATSTADGKSYNCIFYNDRISLWGSVFPKVGNILSIYIMY